MIGTEPASITMALEVGSHIAHYVTVRIGEGGIEVCLVDIGVALGTVGEGERA